MLDTMTLTKAVAAFCGAFLILLLGKWAAEGLYNVEGHGEQAYAIEVEETGGEEAASDAVPFAQVYAAADAGAGEGLWRACQACHKLEDGANGVGPHLYGVVGRDIGSVDGFAYSEAVASLEGNWDPEALDGFLLNPKGYAPGTKMGYAGMKDAEDRADLIAYLNTFEGNADPASYASAAEEAAAEEAPAEGEAAEEAAAEEAPAEGEAAEEAAAEEAPSEEEVAEEAAEEAPAEEEATEMAAADEAPAEEQAAGEQETEEAASEEAPAEEVATGDAAAGDSEFEAAYASADAEAGASVFRQCQACHKIEDGARGAGPHLWGVIGRDIASVEGFRYSDALMELDGEWTPERISGFIEDPKEWAPGTKMNFRGLDDLQDRANLIAYIEANGGS